MSLNIIANEDDPLLIRSRNVTVILDSGSNCVFTENYADVGGVPSDLDGHEQVNRLRRTPEDEMLLTECGIDSKDVIIYDITGLYTNVTAEVVHNKLKCFKNENDKDFYLILDDDTQVCKFNSTFLLIMLKYMKSQKANRFIICLRKELNKDISHKFNKSLRFIGFRKLSRKEQKLISITETHSLYSISVDDE